MDNDESYKKCSEEGQSNRNQEHQGRQNSCSVEHVLQLLHRTNKEEGTMFITRLSVAWQSDVEVQMGFRARNVPAKCQDVTDRIQDRKGDDIDEKHEGSLKCGNENRQNEDHWSYGEAKAKEDDWKVERDSTYDYTKTKAGNEANTESP
jgi:hypothetical protein